MDRKFNIDNLSQLSRIKITNEEKKVLEQNLEKILEYMSMLNEIDTQNISPCAHVLETMKNKTQEDKQNSFSNTDILFKNAPSTVSRMFKIPTVISFEE